MEFFSWAQVAINYLDTSYAWLGFLIGGVSFLLVYVFRTVALFTIAKREKFPHKWMAFIPFFNTYYIGVCSQENKIYNAKAQTVSLIAAIVEAVAFAYFVFYYIVYFTIELNGFFYNITETNKFGLPVTTEVIDSSALALKGLGWMAGFMSCATYIGPLLDLVWFVLSLLIYIAFFQTYATGHYYLFAITSAFFPISGILFFVVRNNHPKNYRAYVRAQQEQIYRMRQQYFNQNPYNQNPYNQNPYNQNPYSRPQNGDGAQDPFNGMGGQSNGNNSQNSQNNGGSDDDDPFAGFDK